MESPPQSPPNPGSDEARALGCTCPVIDNNHGRFPVRPPNDWWISASCPVHYQPLGAIEGSLAGTVGPE